MSEVEVMSVRAPSLDKLEKALARLLAGYAADDVLGVSHSAAAMSNKRSGGVWSGASDAYKVEYSALVLLRMA
jgi:hypothetical protein